MPGKAVGGQGWTCKGTGGPCASVSHLWACHAAGCRLRSWMYRHCCPSAGTTHFLLLPGLSPPHPPHCSLRPHWGQCSVLVFARGLEFLELSEFTFPWPKSDLKGNGKENAGHALWEFLSPKHAMALAPPPSRARSAQAEGQARRLDTREQGARPLAAAGAAAPGSVPVPPCGVRQGLSL